jgi:single-strand DNA-binding protein
MSINRVILIGRLTRDVELRSTPNGVSVANFAIAVDRRKQKDREQEVDFVDIVVWQKLAENCANFIGKGRLVAVEGRLQIRSYQDKEGIRRKVAEVVADNVQFLDKAKDTAQSQPQTNFDGGITFDDSEVPF